jgi:hypothetical protein
MPRLTRLQKFSRPLVWTRLTTLRCSIRRTVPGSPKAQPRKRTFAPMGNCSEAVIAVPSVDRQAPQRSRKPPDGRAGPTIPSPQQASLSPLNRAANCISVVRMIFSVFVAVEHSDNRTGASFGDHEISRTPAGMAGRRASSASSSALCWRNSPITGAAAVAGTIPSRSPSIMNRPPANSTI